MKIYSKIILPVMVLAMTCCTKSDVQSQDDTDNPASTSISIWMAQKTGSTGNWSNMEWKIVLPDGSYFNQLPREGFLNFSRNQAGGTWGTFSMSGNNGVFQNQYETINVKKISDTELEKVGYTNRLYRAASVDGLKLSGSYTSIPNWTVSGNYHYGSTDAQPMISFDLSGKFVDKGAFVTNFSLPLQDPESAPGSGTYQITAFTLTLNYGNGRIVTRSFTGTLNQKPIATSELVFLGGNPFYNK